jgi:hypothetical protein
MNILCGLIWVMSDLQSTDDLLLSDPEMGWHAIKEMTILGKEFAYVPPSTLHSKKVVEDVVGVSSLHASSAPLTERNLDHFGLRRMVRCMIFVPKD